MSLREVYNKDAKELQSWLEKVTFDYAETIVEMLSLEAGAHALDLHSSKPESDMYRRVAIETRSDSTFVNRDEINFYLEESIYYHAKDISEWIEETKDREFVMNVDFGEQVGMGFRRAELGNKNSGIEKYNTDIVTVVLQRSHDSASQTGFFLKTMYPNIEDSRAVPVLGKNLDKALDKISDKINNDNYTKDENIGL